MKNWDTLEADIELLLPNGGHWTPGRAGKIQFIVIHHNGSTLSAQQIYNVWLQREASAHYQVDINGVISQHVNDWDTAWHAADAWANANSIAVEHANSYGTSGPLTAATLDNGAHLVAALCRKYGLGRPQWMVNVFPHSHFIGTACPGHLASSQNAEYMARAQAYYDGTPVSNVGVSAPGNTTEPTQDEDEILTPEMKSVLGDIQARLGRIEQQAWSMHVDELKNVKAVVDVPTITKTVAEALKVNGPTGLDADAIAAKVAEAIGSIQFVPKV